MRMKTNVKIYIVKSPKESPIERRVKIFLRRKDIKVQMLIWFDHSEQVYPPAKF